MREIGQVKAVDGGVATVLLPRRHECGRCGACSMGLHSEDELEIRARNEAGAGVGHRVAVEVGASVASGVVVLYCLPLVVMFVGCFVGAKLVEYWWGVAAAQHGAVAGAVLGLALGFAAVAAYDRWLRRDAARGPRVTSIVD